MSVVSLNIFARLTNPCTRLWRIYIFFFQTVEAPSELQLTESIMAYNLEENDLYLIIDDGEVYPSYKISQTKMATFLSCEEEGIEEALLKELPMKASITIQNEEITQISC